jgi:hypothetical protein
MSICHTVRFRVQNTQEREAREAIDAYVSALIDENPSARLYVASQLEPREEHLEYVQVLVCDGATCTCDDPASALHALQQALGPLNGGSIERQDFAVDHEGPAS